MNQTFKTALSIFVVGALFFVLVYTVGIPEIIEAALAISPIWLIPHIAFFIITKFISTLNLQIVSTALNKKVKYSRMFEYFMLTTALGKFLPGKTGELSLTYLLHKHEKYEYGEGLALQLIDKSTTYFLLGVIAAYGAFFILPLQKEYNLIILATLMLLLVVLTLLWSRKFRRLANKYIIRRFGKYFRKFGNTFRFVISEKRPHLLLNLVVTIAQLFIAFYSSVFLFMAFGASVGIVEIAVVSSILFIIQFFPLPYSGLGVREIAGVYLYSFVGVPVIVSVNFMIFGNLIKYLFSLEHTFYTKKSYEDSTEKIVA